MATTVQSTVIVPRGNVGSVSGALIRISDTLHLWYERAASRRKLSTLNTHLLRDIGLTEADVWEEVRKPFWRA
jgi:uncharacterized protein YjiS (DUF1127 family)